MLEQQATGGMDKVDQESEVAIESPYISGLISNTWQLTALLCCCFMSTLTPTLLFIYSLLPKSLMRLSFMHKVLKIFNHYLNYKYEFTIITGKTVRDHF